MKAETLPVCLLSGDAPLEELVAIELPADTYTLDELQVLVGVLEKYKRICETMFSPDGKVIH